MGNKKSIGVAYSDQDLSGSSNILADATAGQIGYTVGSGGSVASVTQATSKSTGVTLNASAGQVVMNNASLASSTAVTFKLTNSQVTATSIPVVAVTGGYATAGTYTSSVDTDAAGSFNITLTNISGGSLSEAVVISFALINIASV